MGQAANVARQKATNFGNSGADNGTTCVTRKIAVAEYGRYFWENQNLYLCSNFEHECNHNSGFSVRDFSNIIPKGKGLPHYRGVQHNATTIGATFKVYLFVLAAGQLPAQQLANIV